MKRYPVINESILEKSKDKVKKNIDYSKIFWRSFLGTVGVLALANVGLKYAAYKKMQELKQKHENSKIKKEGP